jgi:hypothetical protein
VKRSPVLIAASVISWLGAWSGLWPGSWRDLSISAPTLVHQAAAAPVRVVVQLPQPSGPPSTFGYVCVENGILPVVPSRRDPRRDALLLLEAAEPSADAKPAAKASPAKDVAIRIFGLRFQPEILAVPAGAQVVFRNDDRLPVTLVSSEAPRLFPTTPLPPGATLAVVAPPGTGTLSVRVLEQPQMRATLLTPRGPHRHLRWSPSGEVGVVEMDVPPGVYMARVFFAHHYVASQALTVPDPAVPGRASDSKEATEIVLRTTPASSLSSDGPSPRPSTEPGRGGSAE